MMQPLPMDKMGKDARAALAHSRGRCLCHGRLFSDAAPRDAKEESTLRKVVPYYIYDLRFLYLLLLGGLRLCEGVLEEADLAEAVGKRSHICGDNADADPSRVEGD